MSLKFSSNWKKHYLTHSSDADKPHKCQSCGKAHITATALRNHMIKKHGTEDMKLTMIKPEVKSESFIQPQQTRFPYNQEGFPKPEQHF